MNDDDKSVTEEPQSEESGSKGYSSLIDRLKEGLSPFIAKGQQDLKAAKAIVLSTDPLKRSSHGVDFYKWNEGINEIFNVKEFQSLT